MEIKVSSIKKIKEDLKSANTDNIKLIIASSYDNNIENIEKEKKLFLHFDDISIIRQNSFNRDIAKQINNFVKEIDFDNEELYVCCDSGVSRSSAIAAAILRKYKQNEDVIWKNYNYKPNLLVYKTLCDEFNLVNYPMRLKHKENINKKALKKRIEESKRKRLL